MFLYVFMRIWHVPKLALYISAMFYTGLIVFIRIYADLTCAKTSAVNIRYVLRFHFFVTSWHGVLEKVVSSSWFIFSRFPTFDDQCSELVETCSQILSITKTNGSNKVFSHRKNAIKLYSGWVQGCNLNYIDAGAKFVFSWLRKEE